MAVTSDKAAPYAPTSVITDLIERHRSRGLPAPVTADVLGRAGVTDSLIPRTLQALTTLDLLDENGQPTATFEGIRKAPEGEYKQRLVEWLNSAYADVIKYVDPAKDDEVAVRDAFRNYIPVGQQPRMVSLFIALYAAAGVGAEKATQPRAARPAPARRVTPLAPRSSTKTVDRKPPAIDTGLPPMLAALLASLPAAGSGWTKMERDKIVAMFGTVVDFAFPIVEAQPDEELAEEE